MQIFRIRTVAKCYFNCIHNKSLLKNPDWLPGLHLSWLTKLIKSVQNKDIKLEASHSHHVQYTVYFHTSNSNIISVLSHFAECHIIQVSLWLNKQPVSTKTVVRNLISVPFHYCRGRQCAETFSFNEKRHLACILQEDCIL